MLQDEALMTQRWHAWEQEQKGIMQRHLQDRQRQVGMQLAMHVAFTVTLCASSAPGSYGCFGEKRCAVGRTIMQSLLRHSGMHMS